MGMRMRFIGETHMGTTVWVEKKNARAGELLVCFYPRSGKYGFGRLMGRDRSGREQFFPAGAPVYDEVTPFEAEVARVWTNGKTYYVDRRMRMFFFRPGSFCRASPRAHWGPAIFFYAL